MIDLFSLALTSFVSGMIIGILHRIERLRFLAIILGLGTFFILLIFLGNLLTYVQNPSIDGVYGLIVSSIPFIISCAFSSKGEELIQNFGRHN